MKNFFTLHQKGIDQIASRNLINYEWNLKTDVITWFNIKDYDQNIESAFFSGNNFIHHINHQDFWTYFHHLSQSTFKKNNFDIKYQLNLNEGQQVLIQDQGKLIFSESQKAMTIIGNFRFLENNPMVATNPNFEGYDGFTGGAQKTVFNENLMAYIDQAVYLEQHTAYVMIVFDQLIPMIYKYQLTLEDVAAALKKIMSTVHHVINESHFVGHISGHCIGAVIKNCDEKRLHQFLNSLNDICQNLTFYKKDQTNIPFKISIAGNVISSKGENVQEDLNKVEKQLFKLSLLDETSDLLGLSSLIKQDFRFLRQKAVSLKKIQKNTSQNTISIY